MASVENLSQRLGRVSKRIPQRDTQMGQVR